jgi:hypothetical protein
MQTMQDLIDLQSADANMVAGDAATIDADQLKLTNDQATQQTDLTTQSNDANFFQTSLVETGPVATVNQGSVTIFAAPGAVIPANTPIPLASSVAVPGS